MLIHNGDYKNKCPYWTARLWEDGVIKGEVIGPRTNYEFMENIELKILPSLNEQAFIIPSELSGAKIKSNAEYHIHYKEDGYAKAIFSLSDIENKSYKKILEDIINAIKTNFTEPIGSTDG